MSVSVNNQVAGNVSFNLATQAGLNALSHGYTVSPVGIKTGIGAPVFPSDMGNISTCVPGMGNWWPMTDGGGTIVTDDFAMLPMNLLGTSGSQWDARYPGVTLNGTNNALQMPFAGLVAPAAWPYAGLRHCTNLASLAVGDAIYVWGILTHDTSFGSSCYIFQSGLGGVNGWGIRASNQTTLAFDHRAAGSSNNDIEQFGISLKGSSANNTRTAFALMVTPNTNGQTIECHLHMKYMGQPVRDNSCSILNIARNGIGGSSPATYAAAQIAWGCSTNSSEASTSNYMKASMLNMGIWRRERVAGLPKSIVENLARDPKSFPAALYV